MKQQIIMKQKLIFPLHMLNKIQSTNIIKGKKEKKKHRIRKVILNLKNYESLE